MRTPPSCVSVFSAVMIALVPNSFGQYSGIAKYRKHEQNIDQRLARLETLDLYILSHRDWRRLNHSHAKNIVVHWPDGRRTKGLTSTFKISRQCSFTRQTHAFVLIR